MPVLVTGMCYEEHGDCSELKREIHVKKVGLLYKAYAFKGFDFYPINKGRFLYRTLLKDIEKYKKKNAKFYDGWNSNIVKFGKISK